MRVDRWKLLSRRRRDLIPVAVVAAGTIVAAATGRREVFRVSLGIAALLTLVVIGLSIALANVGYAGVA